MVCSIFVLVRDFSFAYIFVHGAFARRVHGEILSFAAITYLQLVTELQARMLCPGFALV